MTYPQIVLFTVIALVLVGLLWGRWRYDLVAFAALMVAVILGAVPFEHAFDGFGNEATIIVALVLVISSGLSRSGVVDLISRAVLDRDRSPGGHIALFGSVGAALSAFMNNVATLALLMPVDVQAARKSGWPPRRTLMPLSFATILGGLVTLIGTPPNIIVAAYRGEALGRPFAMFDFTPVGLAVTLAGLVFIVLGGWRLIPDGTKDKKSPAEELLAISDYVSELVVAEKSKAIGQPMKALDGIAEENDCALLGLVRRGKRLPGRARNEEVAKGDLIVVQGSPDALNALAGALGLEFQGKSNRSAELTAAMSLSEAVVTRDSRLVGRTANEVQMLRAHGVALLGISRRGKARHERVRRTPIEAGDILLLLGDTEETADVINRLGCLPLADGARAVTRHEKAWLAVGLFAAAIGFAAIGLIHLPIALGLVVVGYLATGVLPIRELYDSIEWPVVVLLGSMIPLGQALDSTGGTALIANGLAAMTAGAPSWVALLILLVVTMTLSDVLNNTATAVIGAPVAIDLAHALNASPDAFLMAVAVGASCAFLTPIGHKNNLLILGPGGYAFGDYWRMGLPLEFVVVAVALPAILVVWPL